MQLIKSVCRTVCNRAAEPAMIVGPEFKIPEDGWVPYLRLGEFPVRNPKAELQGVQVIDQIAAQSIVANHKPGEETLLDFDHFSRDVEKETKAAGWIQGLEIRELVVENRDPEPYVFARVKWSTAGRSSVEGGDYRYISPDLTEWEILGDGRMRPLRAVGGGLTNRTAITGQLPVSNREHEQETNMDYKQILIGLLGLVAEATDEVISNRLTEFNDEVVTNRDAAEKVTTLTEQLQQQTEQLVEGDLQRYSAVISNREEVREQLISNREGTLKLLNGLRMPEPKGGDDRSKVVFNRGLASAPKPKFGEELSGEPTEELTRRAAVISNRASEIIKSNPSTTLPQAYEKAKAELESQGK